MTPGAGQLGPSAEISLERAICQDRAMSAAPATGRELRFACTQCGACCNRSPEVELSEAAALADVFVFRLMFRIYRLPRTLAGHRASGAASAGAGDEFFESKRLLAAFAARKWITKRRLSGKAVETVNYLTLSALTLDTAPGACSALRAGRCAVYARRPLACRTVPFHYSRPEALAGQDLSRFVATPGYRCDTGPGAPIVLDSGRIVDPGARLARGDAVALAGQDRSWAEAIVRRLKTGCPDRSLPTLAEIEADASYGATTISMRVAWQIGAEAGLIGSATCEALIATQAALIDRELASPTCPPDARETLTEMRAEYRAALKA
jgi:Fe-S-cluster containining protein